MKKENLILVLCFVLMLFASIVLSAVQTVFPTSKVDKMFNQKVNVTNEKPVIDADYTNILTSSEVFDLFGNKLADLYLIRTNNTYFYMELYVAIDDDGKVYAMDKKVEAYDDTSESYFPLVRNYILQNYNGIFYENVQFIDGAAGATTIEVSRSIIKNAVSQVIIYHIGEPVDYIGQLFEGEAYLVLSRVTTNSIVITEVTVGASNYTVYQHRGAGTYFDRTTTHTGSITVLIAVDSNGIITHGALPVDLYEHTGGRFYNETLAFLKNMIGNQITDVVPDALTGPTERSDGSQVLVNTLLKDIQEVA